MPIVQKYLNFTKWNNIVHTLLLKIIEVILGHNYNAFK